MMLLANHEADMIVFELHHETTERVHSANKSNKQNLYIARTIGRE
jgi:hypothetical protein